MKLHVPKPYVSAKWTDERVAQITQWRQECIPASQIAARLGPGYTRNMILGLCHRKGIGFQGEPKKTHRHRKAEDKATRKRRRDKLRDARKQAVEGIDRASAKQHEIMRERRIEPVEPVLVSEMWLVPLADLRLNDCRWIEGDPKDKEHRYCGRPSITVSSYCQGHHCMVYMPRQMKKAA